MEHDAFAAKIGYCFHNIELLKQALTHRSHGSPHYERLEFLGDGVLNCIIAAELFHLLPQLPEGNLTRLRASLVNQHKLHETALRINLGPQLLLGEGELRSGGANRPSILADAVEALIGAIFLDGGFETARDVTRRLFGDALNAQDLLALGKDAKTQLQEYLQGRRISLPQYTVTMTRGEAHEQTFCVACAIPELGICTQGEGPNRRSAEQIAARRAFERVTGT
jgi:ribonuclease III